MVEQVKFDYSPLGKVFNKGLTEEDKKEGLLKSVKNIGDKDKELLKEMKNQITKESNKKDSKTVKTKNSLVYDQNHNFYNYRLDKFVEIPSIESTFDIFETFYKDVVSLKTLEAKTKKNTDHKLWY